MRRGLPAEAALRILAGVVYRPAPVSWLVGVLMPAGFVLASALFTFAVLVLGLPRGGLVIVVAFGAFPALILLQQRKLFGLQVVTDDEGFSWALPGTRGRARWDDIVSVRWVIKLRGRMNFFNNLLFLELRGADGRVSTLGIPPHAAPLHRLHDEVVARTQQHLLGALRASVARENLVRFGDFWVSRDCLGHKDSTFPWGQVGGGELSRDMLRVLRAPGLGGGILCSEKYGNVPNAHVLLAWLRERTA